MIEIYQKYLKLEKTTKDGEWKSICPFHQEETASFYVNENTTQYYCFGCGASGNIYKFMELTGRTPDLDLLQTIKTQSQLKTEEDEATITFNEPISSKVIEQLHKNLLNDYSKLQYLIRERLISYFIIKKFLLGYDTSSQRYAIPIKSRTGKFVNIKLHSSERVPKSFYWQEGGRRLFPFSALSKSQVIICEGEFDCLALQSLGISSVTSTSGASNWQSGWNHYFFQKDVIIIYDKDEAGERGSDLVIQNISTYCNSAVNIRFPESFSGKDVTDYLKAKQDIFKLLGLRKKK